MMLMAGIKIKKKEKNNDAFIPETRATNYKDSGKNDLYSSLVSCY